MSNVPAPAIVLVVDDDVGLARLIEKTLRREDFTTAVATSGKAALGWLQVNRPDLLLLDLKLPDIDGQELVSQLAAIQHPVPFVIITGQGDERVAVEMMKRGALDYVVKDVQFQQFLPTVVRRALKQIQREKKLEAAETALRRSEALLAKSQEIAHLGSYETMLLPAIGAQWSEETFRIVGLAPTQGALPREEYLRQVVHPDDQERVRTVVQETVSENKPFQLEYRIRRPDGDVRHVLSIGQPQTDAAGQVTRIVGTLLDITDRKQLEREILNISERERCGIGQDLHDGLCQHLAGIELLSQVLAQNLAKKSKPEAEQAARITQHVREAIAQTRSLARGLSPVHLDSAGLMSALQDLAMNISQMFKIDCTFECIEPVLVHDNAVATHLFRITQEAVSNAVKHGRARRVEIQLAALPERIILAVKDDGPGFPKDLPANGGMGLRIMNYRASMIGGALAVQSDPGGRTTVLCTVHKPKETPANSQAA